MPTHFVKDMVHEIAGDVAALLDFLDQEEELLHSDVAVGEATSEVTQQG